MAKFEKGAIPWNKGRGKIVVCPSMSCHYFVTFGKEKPENLIWGHNLCKVEGRIG